MAKTMYISPGILEIYEETVEVATSECSISHAVL